MPRHRGRISCFTVRPRHGLATLWLVNVAIIAIFVNVAIFVYVAFVAIFVNVVKVAIITNVAEVVIIIIFVISLIAINSFDPLTSHEPHQ